MTSETEDQTTRTTTTTPSKEAFEWASAEARARADALYSADEKLKAARNQHEMLYAKEVNKLETEGKGVLDRLNKLEERKVKAVESNGSDAVSDDDIIEINAGGKVINICRGVLTQQKGTRLEALFSGRWDKKLQRDSRGKVFLDVDGDCFQAIVVYLNEYASLNGGSSPEPPSVYDEMNSILEHQLDLFQVVVPRPWMPDSNIVKELSHVNTLHDWLKSDGFDGEWKLLSSTVASNSLSNELFHKCCGNKGPTIMIIKTVQGGILGGYTNKPWQSFNASFSNVVGFIAAKAFLFSFDVDSNECVKVNASTIKVNYDFDCTGPELSIDGKYVYVEMPCAQNKMHKIKALEIFSIQDHASAAGSDRGMSDGSFFKAWGERSGSLKDPSTTRPLIKNFTNSINAALNGKWKSLDALNEEVTRLENSFKDEEHFIESFVAGDTKDVIALNVSGTMMYTKRATLMIATESVLAQQFDDSKWTVQGTFPPVKAWTANEVVEWVKKIDGIPDDCVSLFEKNKISGSELLTLDKDGLKMLGVERVGTICLLAKEISLLEKGSKEDKLTHIDHNPYCFGKMLEYLRLKQLHSINLAKDPAPVQVRQSQKKSFERVVDYYFPGDSCKKFILG